MIDLSKELDTAMLGLIVLTPDNLSSPWILFEAGAISKSVKESYTCTILLEGLKPADIAGPLSHFQHTVFEKADFRKLMSVINGALQGKKLNDRVLNTVFEKFWPDLINAVEAATKEYDTPLRVGRSDREIMEEVLSLTRFIARNAVPPKAETSNTEMKNRLRKLLYMGLDVAELPERLAKILAAASIENLGALTYRTQDEVLKIKGISKRDVAFLKEYLAKLGLSLGMSFDESVWTDEP